MLPDQTLFLTQLLTLWAVVDPISHLSLFIGATADFTGAERRRAAVISVLLAFVILAVFGLVGQFLLAEMGVSLLSFQIAGGIMLFLFAVSMVLGDASHAVKPPPQARRRGAARGCDGRRGLSARHPDHRRAGGDAHDRPPDGQQPFIPTPSRRSRSARSRPRWPEFSSYSSPRTGSSG